MGVVGGFRREIVRLATAVREAWHGRGARSVALGLTSAFLVALIAFLEHYEPWERFLSDLSATHPTDKLLVLMGRTPLSMFAPAPDLPAWGAIAQVLIVISLAQVVLGWRRTLIVGIGSEFVTNLVGHAFVIGGHAAWMGLHTSAPVFDTGPSVVVVAVALAVALEAPTPRLGAVFVGAMLLEFASLHNLSAHEHLLGLLAGALLWWASRGAQELTPTVAFTGRLQRHRRAVRRLTAATVAAAGALAVASALTAPGARMHRRVTRLLPVGAAHAANGMLAAAGVCLLVLSRGLLRGQRRAWLLSVSAMSLVVATDLARTRHLIDASISLAVLVLVLTARGVFTAHTNRRSDLAVLRSAVIALAVAFVAAIAAVIALTRYSRREARLGVGPAMRVVLNSLFGWRGRHLDQHTAGFLHAGLFGLTAAIAVISLWRALRPVLEGRRDLQDRLARQQRASAIVHRHGGGTLDYFVLRDDKELFFHGDTVIGYTVAFGVCLVSPDPIGPTEERQQAWAEFRAFTDTQGWTVAVLAAGEDWLPVYTAYGMRAVYAGDEAVVDSSTFQLGGGDRKSLRQAVNRIARNGYTVEFHDPKTASAELQTAITTLMTKSRRGGVERGFSMTLGRIFDPVDDGMLLAVCFGPDGVPAAFCQYAPAPGINGWSLDLMRRDPGEHPNGLLDFVVVQTIHYAAAHGGGSVGLNFAAMRALLAAEEGLSPVQRLQRWVLLRLSDSMQIKSLWHFNSKYGPRWIPRYVAVDGTENVGHVAMAIARAESMWELPLIGRWLAPQTATAAHVT